MSFPHLQSQMKPWIGMSFGTSGCDLIWATSAFTLSVWSLIGSQFPGASTFLEN